MEANLRYSDYTKIAQHGHNKSKVKRHILNQVQVHLIYNMNRNLYLYIEIFISTTGTG